MPEWEYCILTRLSTGVDTKWYVNRIFSHVSQTEMPLEVTEDRYGHYNQQFEELHASKQFPILPAALNLLGADGWELIDDMNTGMPGGEGLVFKRPATGRRTGARKAPAKRKGPSGKKATGKGKATRRRSAR